MKIMIADDHPLFAEGLNNLLQANGFNIICIVRDGEEAVKEAISKNPDVILMDIGMPKINGIEATSRIKKELPKARIFILTSFEEEDSLIKAIKAGASGYLLKSIDGDELVRSLNDIKAGKNPFSAGLEDCLLQKIQQNLNNEISAIIDHNLSERQIEVIKLLVKGYTYREIGEELYLSERTIKYHMEQIKEKLAVKTQAQVIAFGQEKLQISD